MSRHILVITRDPSLDDAGDHEKCVYPEHPDDRDYSIECLPGNGCRGWESCPHPHEVNGRSAADGPILDDAALGADGRAPGMASRTTSSTVKCTRGATDTAGPSSTPPAS